MTIDRVKIEMTIFISLIVVLLIGGTILSISVSKSNKEQKEHYDSLDRCGQLDYILKKPYQNERSSYVLEKQMLLDNDLCHK